MGLRGYLVKRVIIAIILFLAVLVFNFFIFRLPVFVLGMDPAALYINPDMDIEDIERLRVLYHLPPENATWYDWFLHFVAYMQNMLTGNFGQSFMSFRPVLMEIMERLPNTLLLMGTSMIFAVILGVVTGILAASRHGGVLDTSLITVSLTLYSLPVFWMGMLFLLGLSILPRMLWGFTLFPDGRTVSIPGTVPNNPISYALDVAWHLVLPCSVLTLGFFGGYMLLMRNTLVDVLTEDYILTARAKGLEERTVLYKHAVRNAFLPLISIVAINFAFIISGAVLTETVFSWHGIGRLLYSSLIGNDWPVAQAIFWMIALTVIVANILADLLYGVLDPRIRYG
ncbi:MAG: ABC transporter permease [Candidatus Hermodarchaeia archaeon]